jgi:hypothetical protein
MLGLVVRESGVERGLALLIKWMRERRVCGCGGSVEAGGCGAVRTESSEIRFEVKILCFAYTCLV